MCKELLCSHKTRALAAAKTSECLIFRVASGGGDGPIHIRPARDSSAALQIASCDSAFEFEDVARKCRENDALDDLANAAEHHALYRGDKSSKALITQAQVFDAIAAVVNEGDGMDQQKAIDNLAPLVLDLDDKKKSESGQ